MERQQKALKKHLWWPPLEAAATPSRQAVPAMESPPSSAFAQGARSPLATRRPASTGYTPHPNFPASWPVTLAREGKMQSWQGRTSPRKHSDDRQGLGSSPRSTSPPSDFDSRIPIWEMRIPQWHTCLQGAIPNALPSKTEPALLGNRHSVREIRSQPFTYPFTPPGSGLGSPRPSSVGSPQHNRQSVGWEGWLSESRQTLRPPSTASLKSSEHMHAVASKKTLVHLIDPQQRWPVEPHPSYLGGIGQLSTRSEAAALSRVRDSINGLAEMSRARPRFRLPMAGRITGADTFGHSLAASRQSTRARDSRSSLGAPRASKSALRASESAPIFFHTHF